MKPKTILIALGAALTSALLFAGLATQSAFAVGFALAAPIPIAIIGLGWGTLAALIAGLAAPVLVFLLTGSWTSATTLLVTMTAPMVFASHLATRRFGPQGTAEPVSSSPSTSSPAQRQRSTEWMPIGRILFVLAISAATACCLIGWMMSYDPQQIQPALMEAFVDPGLNLNPAERLQLENLVSVIIDLIPLIQPSILTLTLVICLHFAGAIVRRSDRLKRPKDDLPIATSLPQDALILFSVALAGTFIAGPAGLIATVFAGALGTAFAFVGLARFHGRMRGRPARGIALFLVYTAILFLTFPLFVFVVIGIVDVWRNGERLKPTRSA